MRAVKIEVLWQYFCTPDVIGRAGRSEFQHYTPRAARFGQALPFDVQVELYAVFALPSVFPQNLTSMFLDVSVYTCVRET